MDDRQKTGKKKLSQQHSRNEDAEILKRLGIISKKQSTSVGARKGGGGGKLGAIPDANFEDVNIDNDWMMPFDSASERTEDDDDDFDDDGRTDIAFDRERLLNNHDGLNQTPISRRNRAGRSSNYRLVCRAVLACSAFFTLGICLAVIGPTLPDIRANTYAANLLSATAPIAANGFGAIVGVAVVGILHEYANSFILMSVFLVICSIITVIIPWCIKLSTVFIICLLQGCCFGAIERGGYSMFYQYWPRKYQTLQMFYISLAFGACLAATITSPLVFDQVRLLTTQTVVVHKRAAIDPFINNSTVVRDDLWTNLSLPSLDTSVKRPETAVGNTLNGNSWASMNEVQRALARQNVQQQHLLTTLTTTLHPTTTTTTITPKLSTTTVLPVNSTTTVLPVKSTTTVLSVKSTTTVLPVKSKTTAVIDKSIAPPVNQTLNDSVSDSSTSFIHSILPLIIEANNARLAYGLISLMALASALMFIVAFAICCIPCSLGTDNVNVASQSIDRICSIRENRLSFTLALFFAASLTSVESILANLLTSFAIAHGNSQSSGVTLTAIYWLAIALSRVLCIVISTSTRLLMMLLFIGSSMAAVMAVFAPDSDTMLWICITSVGFAFGPLYPLTYTWLDTRIGPTPSAATLWLIAGYIGRIIGPTVTAYMMDNNGYRFLILITLVGTIMSAVVFLFLQRTVNVATHLRAVVDFSRNIRTGRYNQLGIIDDDDEPVVYFDRTKDVPSSIKRTGKRGILTGNGVSISLQR